MAIRNFSQSFGEFYESIYLPDHAAPLNRWVHFLSNVSAVIFCGLGVGFWSLPLFALGVVYGTLLVPGSRGFSKQETPPGVLSSGEVLVRLLHQPMHQVILDDSDDERSHPEGERVHWAFLLSPEFLRLAPQAQRSLPQAAASLRSECTAKSKLKGKQKAWQRSSPSLPGFLGTREPNSRRRRLFCGDGRPSCPPAGSGQARWGRLRAGRTLPG